MDEALSRLAEEVGVLNNRVEGILAALQASCVLSRETHVQYTVARVGFEKVLLRIRALPTIRERVDVARDWNSSQTGQVRFILFVEDLFIDRLIDGTKKAEYVEEVKLAFAHLPSTVVSRTFCGQKLDTEFKGFSEMAVGGPRLRDLVQGEKR